MRWYYLGRALLARGHDVRIISSSVFHKYVAPPAMTGPRMVETVDGLTYVWVRTRKYRSRGLAQVLNQLHYAWCAWREAGRFGAGDVDIVVASSPHPLHVFGAWRAARRAGARFVYEVRDLWPDALQQLARVSMLHPYIVALRIAEWFAVRTSHAVVSVKPGDWEHFQRRYGTPPQRVHYLANGFLPSGAPGAATAPAPRTGPEFVVGYVGALSAYYQLDTLLLAAHALRDDPSIRFCIVGGGDAEAGLRQRAAELKLSNVEFVGTVPKSRVPAFLESFDLCYLGLKDVAVNEFGISCNKLFEYMEAGKPIVASYRTRYDPVAFARCGETVAPGDAAGVARVIRDFRDHPELARERGQSGRAYFRANHDFTVIAVRFDEMAASLTPQ